MKEENEKTICLTEENLRSLLRTIYVISALNEEAMKALKNSNHDIQDIYEELYSVCQKCGLQEPSTLLSKKDRT